MSRDKNLFGGKNPRGMYTPMTETEQEALDRLRDRGDLVMKVKGIGEIPLENVAVQIGDHRLSIGPFHITFQTEGNRIVKMPFLDLELWTRAGILLYRDRQAFKGVDGNPMMVSTGLTVPMIWDIGINKIDPNVVKAILPAVQGLTTRRGNERLSPEQQQVLRVVRAGEAAARASTKELVEDAVSKVDNPTERGRKKIVQG